MEQMDLKVLKADIKKWLPWLSEAAKAEWHDFFENLIEEITNLNEHDFHWPLSVLQTKVMEGDQSTTASQLPSPQQYDIFSNERVTESQVSNM